MQPNGLSPWQAWSLEVGQKLQQQHAQIEMLTAEVARLCEKVKELEARPVYAIESIQYHFDQLKVEKLEGTLNIGMTAPGVDGEPFSGNGNGAIDQLAVPKKQVFPSAANAITPPSAEYEAIYAEINRYLDTEAPIKLQRLEAEYGIPIDPYHRRIIVEDVRKQMPARIQYYLQKLKKENGQADNIINGKANDAQIIAKTENDVDAALLGYMQRLKANSALQGGNMS